MSRIRGGVLAAAVLSLSLVACQAQPAVPTQSPTAPPSPTPSPTPSPSTLPYITPPPVPTLAGVSTHDLFPQQSGGVGNMACTDAALYWTSGDLHDIDTASAQGGQARLVAKAVGKVSPLVVSDRWLVWVEYQQEGDGTHLASWTLDALETATGHVAQIASATTATQRQELPMPSVAGDTLVWDELTAAGTKVLWVVDLTTLQSRRLPLPAALYPVRPVVEGTTVAFLDNAADPARTTEFWATRGGRPMLVHLDGSGLQALDGPANAQVVRLLGDEVAWVSPVPDQRVPNTIAFVVQLMRLGTAAQTVGEGGVPLLLGHDALVWYDDAHRSMAARLQATGQVGLAPLDAPGSPGGIALCGSRLYFAGTGLTVKYLQFP